MCGIAGVLDVRRAGDEAGLAALAADMATSLHHRGPDAGGVWVDPGAGLALGHRRLSIVDLSPAGAQPMVSADGRWVIAYNGEVYNADALRADLPGIAFRGRSDTEAILEGCARWGVRATVERLIGMFAFALWDRETRTLHLVRDRLGIKPLYWGRFGPLLLFGSELKALRRHPGWEPEIDRGAVAAFLRHDYVPGPAAIWQGVAKLEPGRILTVRAGEEPRIEAYWRLEDVVRAGQADPFAGTDEEAADRLEALLADAVSRRMIADVPLGAFLSGGIDSSTVVALMQRASDRPVRTFSIGFREQGFDEAPHARAVASHLGTDHTELYVESDDARAVIPRLPAIYDEPFADVSQIPTFLVSELTRRHVTVALSGDGGDELFAGYPRYTVTSAVWRRLGRLPASARRAAGRALGAVPVPVWDAVARMAPGSAAIYGDRVHKLAGALGGDADDLYRRMLSRWEDAAALVPGAVEPRGAFWDDGPKGWLPDLVERMQLLDTRVYLPDDILTKVDRASMAVALEARVPLLDHRVVAFAWSLPMRFKLRGGESKWLLRRVLERHVPRALFERPKMGFGVPIDAWLRGPLRDWAESLLAEDRLRADGLLDPAPIRRRWAEHLSGRRNWQYPLWSVLMLQAWREAERVQG